MADILTPEQRSAQMSRIRGSNTKLELLVRRVLHGEGLRFRLGGAGLPGKPDLVFPKYQTVLFVHGCFWHAHNCGLFRIPKSRSDFWTKKLMGNRARDERVTKSLRELGWRCVVIWECELRSKTKDAVVARLKDLALNIRAGREQCEQGRRAMEGVGIANWLQQHAVSGTIWYLKRLAANDTKASKANQAGPYLSKSFLFEIFPQINDKSKKNPDAHLSAMVDSHETVQRRVRVIWYNSKHFGKTRDETRITGWGGISSPLLDPDSTGALTAFVFRPADASLHVWVCRNPQEEELLEDRTAVIEPGAQWAWRPNVDTSPLRLGRAVAALKPCRLTASTAPPTWLVKFPSGAEIVDEVVSRRPLSNKSSDKRLLARRECEFEMFLSVEEILEGPRIASGFASVDEFVAHAQSILQRRKSRSGRSLELHLRNIFREEKLEEGVTFSHQPESDPGKKPDFLFPSEAAYKNPTFPANRLRMLAAKTTCKDRWRQVTHEADRIKVKHLLTLQEGVSVNQFNEMKAAGVQLVVPSDLIKKYPKALQPALVTLEEFIALLDK